MGAPPAYSCAPVLSPDDVMDKAKRFLDVMAKQLSGFEIKVFAETQRKDQGPYQLGVNSGLVERGWMHDYGKGQVAYSGPVLNLVAADQRHGG